MVTPAAIVLLGDRLDSLDCAGCPPAAGPPEPVPRPIEQTFWYRSAQVRDAPRRPIGLGGRRAAAGARRPVPRGEMGISRRPGAASSASARQVGDELRTDFAALRDRV